jgi:predicted esterase
VASWRAALLWLASACATPGQGIARVETFASHAPYARNAEIATRMLTPLIAARVLTALQAGGEHSREFAIELANERFDTYVPPHAPASGYGVLVFVPPWDDSEFPDRWEHTLDEHGIILVIPVASGNDRDVLDRRVPLALEAAYNVAARYRVDPARVYIGGFSGGSHVALRVALAYPDVFHGALLNAGSDPIGTAVTSLPSPELFAQFQAETRIVYATGSRDDPRFEDDAVSKRSLERWCVFDAAFASMPDGMHQLPDVDALRRALAVLEHARPMHDEQLAACRARLAHELDSALAQVDVLAAAGNYDRARAALIAIDEQFGGLAGPRVLAKQAELAARRPR